MHIEPRSDFRQMAVLTFEMYTAYCQAGFSEPQAMQLTTAVLVAQIKAGNSDD